MTTVINVPMNGDFDPSKSTAVMAPGDTVYASVDSLYVATTRWVESEAFDDEAAREYAWRQRRTSIHRFDITDADAGYEGSGEVEGVHRQAQHRADGHRRADGLARSRDSCPTPNQPQPGVTSGKPGSGLYSYGGALLDELL